MAHQSSGHPSSAMNTESIHQTSEPAFSPRQYHRIIDEGQNEKEQQKQNQPENSGRRCWVDEDWFSISAKPARKKAKRSSLSIADIAVQQFEASSRIRLASMPDGPKGNIFHGYAWCE